MEEKKIKKWEPDDFEILPIDEKDFEDDEEDEEEEEDEEDELETLVNRLSEVKGQFFVVKKKELNSEVDFDTSSFISLS